MRRSRRVSDNDFEARRKYRQESSNELHIMTHVRTLDIAFLPSCGILTPLHVQVASGVEAVD